MYRHHRSFCWALLSLCIVYNRSVQSDECGIHSRRRRRRIHINPHRKCEYNTPLRFAVTETLNWNRSSTSSSSCSSIAGVCELVPHTTTTYVHNTKYEQQQVGIYSRSIFIYVEQWFNATNGIYICIYKERIMYVANGLFG